MVDHKIIKMASQEVKAQPSSATESQIFSALYAGWQQVFGTKPTLNQLANAWSQIAIETGRGKYILNNNVGNINWTQGNSHDYYMTHDDRSINGNPANRETYSQARRAYPTLLDGVVDYLTLLKNRPGVMQVINNDGTPEQFSWALADAKYYDPYVRDDYIDNKGHQQKGYTSHLASLHNELINKYNDKQITLNPTAIQNSEIVSNYSAQSLTDQNKIDKLEKMLSGLLQAISSSSNKSIIKRAQNKNNFTIKIKGDKLINKIEFARILSAAIEEEMLADTYISSDQKDKVEISCSIYNNDKIKNENDLLSLCSNISYLFEEKTKKIGNIKLASLISNKPSPLPDLSLSFAQSAYNEFHLQFLGHTK